MKRPEFPIVVDGLPTEGTHNIGHKELLQAITRALINLITFAEVLDANSNIRGHQQTPYVSFGTRPSPAKPPACQSTSRRTDPTRMEVCPKSRHRASAR